MKDNFPYTIKEVSGKDSSHLPGMVNWLNQLFPDYAPYFGTILNELRQDDGRHKAQIYTALAAGQVVGLVQVFYRQWQNGLVADIDLLGVLEPHRRLGLGSTLAKRAILAAQETASRYELPAIGVVSLADLAYGPVIRLHQKLGGQIRTDFWYPSGDVIIWYPLLKGAATVETKALAWQLWQFGGLPEEEFVNHYGKPEDLEWSF